MNEALLDTLAPAMVQDKRRQRGQLNLGPFAPHLELDVECAMQGSRRCRRCAAVHGRYVCVRSAAVRNEWRHSATDLELIVHLLTCQEGSGPHLQAMIRVERGNRMHARAIYSCELLTGEPQDSPWTLKLISEQSECDFVFPGQVEVVSSGKLLMPRESLACRNG